jgi:hypothetical protein
MSSPLDEASAVLAVTADDVAALRAEVQELTARVQNARRRNGALLAAFRSEVDERVRKAGIARDKPFSEAVTFTGSPSDRLSVRRLSVGQPFEGRFDAWMGITCCASTAPDVREAWEKLLASEASTDGLLRGAPNMVLDIPGGTITRDAGPGVDVRLTRRSAWGASGTRVVAVPKCTHDFPSRKLGNFGHWLLDCVPQVVALASVAPEAVFLLPASLKGFHRATLSLAGISESQMVPWDGAPVTADRLLVFESDGRSGGGRPLAALKQMRERLAPPARRRPDERGRRIYVSRRDARKKRRWADNEPDIEALFEQRGFEIRCMADHSLAEQLAMFREASVVAGVSGAGLADIVVSAPGTHVIVLVSDSLVRWYADDTGARAMWLTGQIGQGQLAALGDSPRFYAYVAAAFEQTCHYFVAADAMPLVPLSQFLDDVLRQVGE